MEEKQYLVKLYSTCYIPGKGKAYLFTFVEKGAYIYVTQFYVIFPKIDTIKNIHSIVTKRYNLENDPIGEMPELSIEEINKLNLDPASEVLYEFLSKEFDGNFPAEYLQLQELDIEKEKLLLQLKYKKEIEKMIKEIDLDGCKSFLQTFVQGRLKISEEKEE
jgi:hypothetical protein